MAAIDKGHKEIVDLLIENGAKVNRRQPKGQLNALMLARQRGYNKIEDSLLKAGAKEQTGIISNCVVF